MGGTPPPSSYDNFEPPPSPHTPKPMSSPLKNETPPPHLKNDLPPFKHETPFHEVIPRKSKPKIFKLTQTLNYQS